MEAGPPATAAGRIGPVAAQENADVHLVGSPFKPFKKALHAIPLLIFPRILRAGSLTVEDPALLLATQVREGAVEIQASAGPVEFEISLALLPSFSLEGFYTALVDGAGMVWNRLVEINADDTAKASAVRACSHRVVEAEESGSRGSGGEPCERITPICSEGSRRA